MLDAPADALKNASTVVSPTENLGHSTLSVSDTGESAATVTFDQQTPSEEASRSEFRFGDYEIIGKIAAGGMGVVYKARQTKLNRLVALKMIKAGELAGEEQVERFYAEAKAAAKLDHPGIVPVYEVGSQNGQHFFSMAIIEGSSLSDKVKSEGPLPPKKAAEIMKAVAEAVQFGHDKGIVHRDIKPQNILLDESGSPRVTDFGLAKHADSEMTLAGQVMGTPSYMPPEQAEGKQNQIGPVADVYSLGATLYFLLTGRPPFQAASTTETLRQVIENEPVSPTRLNSTIPRDLETICLMCLRKEPRRRYASASALSHDFKRWLSREPIHARPVSRCERIWLSCRRNPMLAVTVAVIPLLLLIGVSAVSLLQFVSKRQLSTQKQADERIRAKSLVESTLTAPADGLPLVIDSLRPLKDHAVPLLRRHESDTKLPDVQRLHAAIALAQLGEDVDCRFVVGAIASVDGIELSCFSGNWNFSWLVLANKEGHPATRVAASCREGLSLWCQSRSGCVGCLVHESPSWLPAVRARTGSLLRMKPAGRRREAEVSRLTHAARWPRPRTPPETDRNLNKEGSGTAREGAAPTPVLAPGTALGSHLCVALSSARAVIGCSVATIMRQAPTRPAAARGLLPASGHARRRSPRPGR